MIISDEAKTAINAVLDELKEAAKNNECLCDFVEMELAVMKTKEGGASLKIGLIPGIEAGATIGGERGTQDYSQIKVRFTPYLSDEDATQLSLRTNITSPDDYQPRKKRR